MSFSRQEFAENILRLKDNGHWRYYVSTLEAEYNKQVESLLVSDHPDEAKRGECRALLNLLKKIHSNSGNTP
jgi:hypothetical protein